MKVEQDNLESTANNQPTLAPNIPTLNANSTSKTVKPKKQLRRPKQETIDKYKLLENNENTPSQAQLDAIKTEPVETDTEHLVQGSGYWLSADDINWAGPAQLPARLTQYTAPSWEEIYDRFYSHPDREQNSSESSTRRSLDNINYRHTDQYRSEESDPASDPARSSVSACSSGNGRHVTTPNCNHRRGYQGNRPADCGGHCAAPTLNSENNLHDPCHPDNRAHPRRFVHRQRRPLGDYTNSQLDNHHFAYSRRYPGRTPYSLSQIDLRTITSSRFSGQHSDTPQTLNYGVNESPPSERLFDNKLNSVCQQVETLNREVHELRNLAPHRRSSTYPRTHLRW